MTNADRLDIVLHDCVIHISISPDIAVPKVLAEDDIEPNPKVDEDIGASREGSRTGESCPWIYKLDAYIQDGAPVWFCLYYPIIAFYKVLLSIHWV